MDNRKFQSAASASIPVADALPSVGYPTDGNPTTGTPATVPGAFWFYQLGEEVRAVQVENGLVPSTGDLTQLAKAISTRSTDSATRYRKAALSGCSVMIEI